jgi:hypothetical protein
MYVEWESVQGESDSAPWFLTQSQPRQHLESLALTPQDGAPEDRPSLRSCLPSEPTQRSDHLWVDSVLEALKKVLEALKKVCAPDGVHFTAVGYQNMVAAILGGDSQLTVSSMSVKSGKPSHYWRGFKSTRGSVSASMRGGKSARGGRFMRQFHPYRRGK